MPMLKRTVYPAPTNDLSTRTNYVQSRCSWEEASSLLIFEVSMTVKINRYILATYISSFDFYE